MKNILIVEDNETIIKGLSYSLKQENFNVIIAINAKQANTLLKNDSFDLVILDITLPDGNGFDICKYIKQNTKIPVIFLTAKDEERDVVLGFDLGADDYIIKPFRIRELISRINNVMRRINANGNILKCGKIKIDLDSTKIYVDDKEVVFTALEYKILVILFSNINKTMTRDQLLDKIWDNTGNFVNDNTLTVYIKRIRNKLGEHDNIKTIKGMGYRVDE